MLPIVRYPAALVALTLFLSTICTVTSAIHLSKVAFAQDQSNGNGNAGGNNNGNGGGNGNGNAGGNAGGNGNGNAGGNGVGKGSGSGLGVAPSSQGSSPVAVSQQTFAISAAQVVKMERAVKDALQLAEKTQKVLRLALINSENNAAYLNKVERLLRRSPQDEKLLGRFKALQGQLANADDALAAAYRNHLKALSLLQGKRRLRDVANRRHQRLVVKRK